MNVQERLRQLQERKRAELGLPTGTETMRPHADQAMIEVPCRICGKPILNPALPSSIRLPRLSGIAHQECLAENARRQELERHQSEIQRRQEALAAVRADLPAALRYCGVPEHWLPASFEACGDLPEKLVQTAREWAARPVGMLYLFGVTGAGKTWLAVAILRAVLEQGAYRPKQCRYVEEREYLLGLKAAFSDGSPPPRLLPADNPARVPLLVYDDLASAMQTVWTRDKIGELLEARHARELPTIITGNIPPAEIAKAIDGRTASRIAESHMMLEFPKRDLRLNCRGDAQEAAGGKKD